VALQPLPPRLVPGLCRARAYPGDPSAAAGVAHVQTHLSHVFLTGERVYKLRKAVDLGFVSFASRAERNADCVREVRLGRRLAPDVYLGVAPVRLARGGTRVGRRLETPRPGDLAAGCEHVVVMRRLPDGRDALSLLAARRLRAEQLDAVARLVADFHRRHRLTARVHGARSQWLARSARPVRDNFALLRGATLGSDPIVSPVLLARASEQSERFLDVHADRFETRRTERRGVDGHGDLHLQHVFFERDDAAPILIDCIEFRDDLRQIDAAAEVAFLAMDLRYRGRADLAERFLAAYAAAADDFGLYGVVDFYVRYRAAVRAKVAVVAAGDAGVPFAQRRAARTSARRHLALAARERLVRGRPALILTCGTVGSGKSRVARAVARRLGAVTIVSDVVRKADARRGARGARYSERAKDAVYRGLLDRAAPVIASGRIAVLDATFDHAARRQRALRWAAERGVPALLLEVRCTREVARRRLAKRATRGRDASEAGPEQLAASLARFEAPDEWPRAFRHVVRTDGPWRATLDRALAALARRGGRGVSAP
jgi:hypothetical protein